MVAVIVLISIIKTNIKIIQQRRAQLHFLMWNRKCAASVLFSRTWLYYAAINRISWGYFCILLCCTRGRTQRKQSKDWLGTCNLFILHFVRIGLLGIQVQRLYTSHMSASWIFCNSREKQVSETAVDATVRTFFCSCWRFYCLCSNK